jgi:hypothetical protein
VFKKNVTGLLLAVMVFAGLTYATAGQRAFAHNFSHDETTEFLAAVEMTKTYLQLAKSNLSKDPELARIYAERAATFLDEHWIGEIAERNERLATQIPQSLSQLGISIDEARPAEEVKADISDIRSFLSEAVSVRIDRAQLTNSTTQSLVLAKVLSEALLQYQVAYGVEENLAYELSYGIRKMNMTGDMGTSMSGSSMSAEGSVDMVSYQAAKALVGKALYIMLLKVKKSDATDPALVDAAKTGLWRVLWKGIGNMEPWQQMLGTMHQQVHENLRKAFNLQVQS